MSLESFNNFFKPGSVFIGISDSGEIKGVQLGKSTINNWMNQISQITEPRLVPETKIIEYGQKNIVIIKITEFPLKPVSIKGRCFKRIANANRIMMPQEISDMHISTKSMSWDKFPADGAFLEDIDLEKLNSYIKKVNTSGRRNIPDNEQPFDTLKKLGLISKDKISWATVLLFAKNPSQFLPQASVHCGSFKDNNLVIDDRMFRGTIIEQVEDAMGFLRKNLNVKLIMTGKPERDEVWDYPLEALREGLINAICHRDYSISSNIEIRIYDNKLIISSPGKLPADMTIEDLYKTHSSVLRNKGIAGIFYDLGLIEQWGSGIDKMRTSCKKQGLSEPEFKEGLFFQVIFKKDIYTEEILLNLGLNKRQIKAIGYIKEHGKITNREYREITGISKEWARKDLKALIKMNILLKKGRSRNIHYVLK